MSEVLLVSVIISAKDMASQIFAKLGVAAKSTYGVMAMGAAGVAGGLIAIGAAANHYASEFQTQFARISGLTGSSSEQLKYYQDNLIQLSAQYDLTSADAAKALYFIISAGLDPLGSAMQRAKENMDVLRYSSMSATASLADQATVADAMTSMMKAFADSNITAADAANTLTRIEVYGKATLSAFASSLGFTMTTAKAAGVTMHETAAAVATLSQVSGQHGIRRMQMELSNLMRSLLDVNAIAKRAKAQGLNFDEAAFSTMTFIGKLQYLQHLTGALSSNINDQTYAQMVNMDATKNQLQATAALDKQLDISNSNFMKLTGGAAAFIPATILLEQHASNYTQILTEMNKKQDIVKAAFDNMRNTANQQWKMAEIGLQNLLVVIGLQLLPVLQGVYHAIYLVTNGLIAWLQNTANMTAFKYALLGIAIVVGTILTPAIVGLALAFVTNPIFLSIMAIVGAGILLGKVLATHPEIIKRVQQALAGLMGVVNTVTATFHTLADIISGGTKKAADAATVNMVRMRLTTADNTLRMQQVAEKNAIALDQSLRREFAKSRGGAETETLAMKIRVADHMVLMRKQAVAEAEKMRAGVVQHLKTMSAQGKPALSPLQQAFASLTAAIQLLLPVLNLAVTILSTLVTVAARVIVGLVSLALWVTNNEFAFNALKAVLITIGVVMGVNMVEDLTLLAGKLLWVIPLVWAQAEAWIATAAAAVIAELPLYLLIAAIAALIFIILELVQHWSQVKAFFANIAAAVGSFFSWLGGHVHDALGHVGAFFQAAFDKIGQVIHWFTTLTPNKIAYMVGYALGFLIGLPVRGAAIIATFVWKGLQFLGHLATEAPGYIGRMKDAVIAWLGRMKDEAIKHIVAFAVGIVTELVKLWHEAPGFILKMALAIVAWLLWLKDAAWQKIKQVTAAIWTEIQKLPGQAVQVIKDFISGLVNGIKNGVGSVVDALKHLAGGMIDGFKNALGIHSPSTVMFAHGVNIVQGLINGFRSIDVGTAWLQHVAGLSQPITPALAGAGSGGAAGQPFRGLHLPQGGGVHAPVYNITVNAPTSNAPELVKAIRDEMDRRERDNYHKARRSGYGGGLHAGIGGTEVD